MRINRFLAAAGFGSRRGCEELIRTGRVTINGQVCASLATEVADTDFVKVNGKRAQVEERLYVLLHKPRGYLCTASDERDRRTIFELLPKHWPRIFHVGRLDKDSEGLLLLTNDGDLSLALTHPRFKIEKEYEVLLDRPFDLADREKLLKGVFIEGVRAKADAVHKLTQTVLRVILRQGLKRQIRLMFRALGYEVKRLGRNRIGSLRLEGLQPGEWRFLTQKEVAALKVPARETAVRAPQPRRDSSVRQPLR
ncbi:MAG: rRNA synthase [Chthoniobacter sp.]|jgi:23S rRNA pseudouridine2605 synthase|nr:rRNA synthase [Chthoniobacter sp.]